MSVTSFLITAFMKTKEWEATARKMSDIKIRFGYHDFDTSKYLDLKKIVAKDPQAIYAFVCRDDTSVPYKLEKLLFKSKYSHAGILIRGTTDDDLTVIHIEPDGLLVEHVLKLVDKIDKFTLVKLHIDEKKLPIARDRICEAIANKEKYKYDFKFSMRNSEWERYCSEFVYGIGAGLVEDPDFKPHFVKGVENFKPDDIVDCGEIVFDS